jgi:hypothetical protein
MSELKLRPHRIAHRDVVEAKQRPIEAFALQSHSAKVMRASSS